MDIRNLLALLCICLLMACGQGKDVPENKAKDTAVQPVKAMPRLRTPNDIDSAMLKDIITYYRQEYGQGTREEIVTTDTSIELNYHSIPNDFEHFDGVLTVVYIPRLADMSKILHGDMNSDGRSDKVVMIHEEGEGGGGNMWNDDFFLFIGDGTGKYKFACVGGDGAINGCGGGHFYADTIKDGYLVGEGQCYKGMDGNCCPSLHYETKVKYQKGELVFAGKKLIREDKQPQRRKL